jgi:L-threonylcarbamoyladenylate synthase
MVAPQAANPCLISTAAELLALGHLVAFPTETVYGLGADGLNPNAVAKIFQAKGRPADHPVILHVADTAKAKRLAMHWPAVADELAEAFWPGPLTLILKRAGHVPDCVTGGQDTVGVRVPSHPVAQTLLRDFAGLGSGVIAAPSANRFGGISPTRAIDVATSIGSRLGPHDVIIDGGDCDVGVESTIVDVSGDAPRILRPGGISREAIEAVMSLAKTSSASVPRVSGALASHYAPNARTLLRTSSEVPAEVERLLTQDADQTVGCVVITATLPTTLLTTKRLTVCAMSNDPVTYAHDLYATLNDLDRRGVDVVVIESPPATVAWEAVLDRLGRAAHG